MGGTSGRRARKIDLRRCKPWRASNDPEFAAQSVEIVGLIILDSALVFAVDEKPCS
jgi:hypothetical protein